MFGKQAYGRRRLRFSALRELQIESPNKPNVINICLLNYYFDISVVGFDIGGIRRQEKLTGMPLLNSYVR